MKFVFLATLLFALVSRLGADVSTFTRDDLQQLDQKLETLEKTAAHPFFARHLRSLRALANSEWARLELAGPGSRIDRTVREDLQTISKGLQLGNDRWEAFRDAGQPLVFAYLSKRDQTLQFYNLVLPREWKESERYPLYLELHGSLGADTRPLGWPSQTLGIAPDFKAKECPVRTYAMAARNGFHVLPYGRGNSGYEDIGEIDVWEALEDVDAIVKIDPTRRYLYGFSMGGGGTYNLVGRRPELWAAAAILGGSPGLRDADEALAAKMSGIPIFLWCGENDPWAAAAHRKAEILLADKKAPREMIFAQNIAHAYLGDVQEKAHTFMSAYTRPDAAKSVERHSGEEP